MFSALHALLYSDDADATRAFFRDVLEWPYVESQPGSNWLIFRSGPSELGVHPTREEHHGQVWETTIHHEVSLMTEDIAAAVEKLKSRGVEFVNEPEDHGYGLVACIKVPGARNLQIYQPKHPIAHSL
jgi:predicted enzyme related to lactoylglutathione lyase